MHPVIQMLSDKTVFRLHRLSGLIGGLFILILTLTGSILVVDKQVDALLSSNRQRLTVTGPLQPYDKLLATLHRQYPPARLTQLQLADADKPAAIRFDLVDNGVWKWVAMNPCTGAIVGVQNADDAFVRQVRELHENLLLEPVGGYVMGLAGVCLLASVLTGTWYYRRSLLSVFRVGIRWKKPRRIVYADLHKWLGVVALLFMLLMSSTGIFFHWELIERAFGAGETSERPTAATAQFETFPLDAAIRQATTTLVGFRPQLVQFPEPGDTLLILHGNHPNSIRLLGEYNVSVRADARTGQFISSFDARGADLEYVAEHVFEELHFGRYGGWVSQVIYILLALSTAIVTITGLVLWYLKRM